MQLMGLPADLREHVVRGIVGGAWGREANWREVLRALLTWYMTCRRNWVAAARDTGGFLAEVCDGFLLDQRGTGLPPWKVLSLNVTVCCHVCRVTTPAPVRRGLGMRCCAWCFENGTIPEDIVSMSLPDTDRFAVCRSDYRLVRVCVGGYRCKKRQKVYLLRDLLAVVSR